jgi:hypothetical protein
MGSVPFSSPGKNFTVWVETSVWLCPWLPVHLSRVHGFIKDAFLSGICIDGFALASPPRPQWCHYFRPRHGVWLIYITSTIVPLVAVETIVPSRGRFDSIFTTSEV